ncbi:MAG: hypothetical protein KIT79_06590 [Deltaproteobacteria bacterium]|nr:hypothetical protein [Deltaproteobacteria bacterium]
MESASPKALGRISCELRPNLFVRNGAVGYSLVFPFDMIAEGNKDGDWRAAGDDLGTFCLDHAAELNETDALIREFLVTADNAA